VYHIEGRTLLKFFLSDAVMFKPESGELSYAPELRPPKPLVLISPARDNPKALTRTELLNLRHQPDEYGQVMEARSALAEAVQIVEARNSIDAQLRSSAKVVMIDSTASERTYEIHADRLDEGQFSNRDGRPLELIQSESGTPTRRMAARAIIMTQSSDSALADLTFDLEVQDFLVTDLRAGGSPNQRASLRLPALRVAGAVGSDVNELSAAELLKLAAQVNDRSSLLKTRVSKLNREISSLMREISARLANRYALSLTALLLLSLGSTLAMWLRRSLPLTVYLWAFVPSILDLILISAGEQMMRDGRLFGPFVMWSGNAVLLILWGYAYFRLSRN
jgi:hypothetical protein